MSDNQNCFDRNIDCFCMNCKEFEECEPCREDHDYEHPCNGGLLCEEYKSKENI